MLWFDGEWLALGGNDWTGEKGWFRKPDWAVGEYMRVNYFWESEKIINEIRKLQPGIMINNRFGWEGDFHTRERRIDEIRTDKPWDSCDCIADSWGYIPGREVLSLRELIHNLVSIVVRDGNYLLNVGPTGDGNMEEEQVKRLAELGVWMKQYGETLYGTRGGPVIPGSWGGTTYKENKVYVHIMEWKSDKIRLQLTGNKLKSWKLWNVKSADIQEKDGYIQIEVPEAERDAYDTIIELEFENPIQWEGASCKENDVYGLADGLD